MADQWYYTSNRQQKGPVPEGELRRLADAGVLRSSDLVWKEGMADWVGAGSQGFVAEDRRPAAGAAELLPPRSSDDERPRRRRQLAEDDEFEDDYEDRPRRRRRRPVGMPLGVKIGLIAGGALALLAVVGITLYLTLRGGSGGPAQDVPVQGLVFNDTLRPSDARDKKMRNHCKVFNVNFTANSTYIIEHRSGMFDAFLRLEDPSGREVAFDDDSGGGLDARIVHRASQTGAYRVIATSLDGRTGNFTLTIRKI